MQTPPEFALDKQFNHTLLQRLDGAEREILQYERTVELLKQANRDLENEVRRLKHYGSYERKMEDMKHHVKMLASALDMYIDD